MESFLAEDTKRSRLQLLRYNTLQVCEVDEHKYFLSKERGYDVGSEFALEDWIASIHAPRFRDAFKRAESEIEKLCNEFCGDNCRGVGKCPFPMQRLHALLNDAY